MLGRPVSSAVSAFGPYPVALLILLVASGITPLAFKVMQHFREDDAKDQSPATPVAASQSPPTHPTKTDRPKFPHAGAYVHHELESTIIPVIDFKETTTEEALDFVIPSPPP